jgi:preprotein translocase subunit SecB
MTEVKSAAFQFSRYKIPVFTFVEASNSNAVLRLSFNPTGKYIQSDGVFEIQLDFQAFEEGSAGSPIISVKFIGYFEFEKGLPFESIPDYFYKNSIAILFPYIRAFISTLTLQANNVLLLGLMNLTGLEVELRANSKSE